MKSRHPAIALVLVLSLGLTLLPGCDGDSNDERVGIVTATLPFSLNLTGVAFTDFVANMRYDVPLITPNVVSFGAVLVFIRDLENTWTALPFTYGVESATDPFVDYTVSVGYAYESGFLDVFVESSSSDDLVWDQILDDPLLRDVRDLRLVILESFVAGKGGVDLSDYSALQRYYGLPD